MRRKTISFITLIHLQAAAILCSVSDVQATEAARHRKVQHHEQNKFQETVSFSTKQTDVTTPITIANPVLNPTEYGPAQSSVGSWCVASKSAAKAALQAALDYACGYSGGVDCSAIQPGGGCYWPAAVTDHASYAFNSYYQKNPIPSSCNFGGSAVTTSTDPSYGSCKYPSISITSSVLNITNSSGSQIYGAGPVTPSTSATAALLRLDFTSVTCIFVIWYSLLFLPLVK